MSLFIRCSRPTIVAAFTITAACGPHTGPHSPQTSTLQQAWNGANDPRNIGKDYERRLDQLPTYAEIERKPWADSYWPNYAGGIADRWVDPSRPNAFYYQLNDRNALYRMDAHSRALLSPAEKYDILQGRFDYPTVQEERQRAHASDPKWYGLCNGLAPASVNFNEPKPVNLRSVDGIDLYFGSSDVKALLIYAQAKMNRASYAGRRCDADLSKEPWRANDEDCKGVNAGSFHIALSNFVGRWGRGLVADITRAHEIWNHPIFAYSTRKTWESWQPYAGAAPGTVRVVAMHTQIRYIGATYASWQPTPYWQKRAEQEKTADYDYLLELNGRGEIIGGEWKSWDRPGFVWHQDRADMGGYLNGINRVYAASQY